MTQFKTRRKTPHFDSLLEEFKRDTCMREWIQHPIATALEDAVSLLQKFRREPAPSVDEAEIEPMGPTTFKWVAAMTDFNCKRDDEIEKLFDNLESLAREALDD